MIRGVSQQILQMSHDAVLEAALKQNAAEELPEFDGFDAGLLDLKELSVELSKLRCKLMPSAAFGSKLNGDQFRELWTEAARNLRARRFHARRLNEACASLPGVWWEGLWHGCHWWAASIPHRGVCQDLAQNLLAHWRAP